MFFKIKIIIPLINVSFYYCYRLLAEKKKIKYCSRSGRFYISLPALVLCCLFSFSYVIAV